MDTEQIFKILHSKATPEIRKKALEELYKNVKEDQLDYDYRGAIEAGLQPDERGHWSDEFKKPNHITASEFSRYNTKEKPFGKWVQLPKAEPTGEEWAFEPTDYQVKQFGEDKYKNYFKKYESGKGGAIVRLPEKSALDKLKGMLFK